jgi:hypothetical protein
VPVPHHHEFLGEAEALPRGWNVSSVSQLKLTDLTLNSPVQLSDGEQGRDGDRWWTTSRNGFTTGVAGRTGVEVPEAETQPFEELWDPALLIAELWLEPGEQTYALGRRGHVVRASPRPTPRSSGLDFILLEWPGGDAHELVVDLELGIVLRLRSFWHGQELIREEVVELKVDPMIPDGLFLDEGAR